MLSVCLLHVWRMGCWWLRLICLHLKEIVLLWRADKFHYIRTEIQMARLCAAWCRMCVCFVWLFMIFPMTVSYVIGGENWKLVIGLLKRMDEKWKNTDGVHLEFFATLRPDPILSRIHLSFRNYLSTIFHRYPLLCNRRERTENGSTQRKCVWWFLQIYMWEIIYVR